MSSHLRNLVLASTLGVAVVVTLFAGCGGGSAKKPSDEGTGRRAAVNRKACNDLLETALGALQPDEYHVGDTTGALTLLGSWRGECASQEFLATRKGMIGEHTAEILDETRLERAEAETFTERDATHIRSSLLYRRAAEAAIGDADTELAKVRAAFAFVVRNVQLVGPDDALAGRGLFDALVFGEGSARDRAWAFAAVLRQLRIDAVIVRPAADEPREAGAAANDRWLVGVLLDGQCHLFDTRLGIAVPGPDDDPTSALPSTVATLADVRADGDLLATLDVPGADYPLDDADLDEVRIEVIGNSSLYAPRLLGLQGILTGHRTAVIVDSFDDPEGRLGRLGIVARLERDAQDVTAEPIGVWAYPEFVMDRTLDDLSSEARSRVLARREVFTTAVEGERRWLLHGRFQQLRGNYYSSDEKGANAIAWYTAAQNVGTDAGDIARESSRDARFWKALTDYETGSGEKGLAIYADQTWTGRFEPTARLLVALGRADRGSRALAIEELHEIDAAGPLGPLVAYLKHRWASDGTAPPEADPTTEEAS